MQHDRPLLTIAIPTYNRHECLAQLLEVLAPQLDKEILVERFRTTCPDFLAAPRLKELAANNWRIIFGEDLPTIS